MTSEEPKTSAPLGIDDAPEGSSSVARGLRGFGPLGLLAILVILAGSLLTIAIGALLVLLWVHLSETPWKEIGYARPRSWPRTIVVGILLGVVLKLLMKSVVMPLLGADPINHAYHGLVGNTAAIPGMLFLFFVGAGFGEETLFRGWMFERLGKLLGSSLAAKIAILVLTSVLFGLLHYRDQGLAGAEQAIMTGLVMGTLYKLTGRIWMPMITHVAFDLVALAIIYGNLETRVAHWFFH